MKHIFHTIRHTARAAAVLLLALLAAQTAGAQTNVSNADELVVAFNAQYVSEINVTDNITGVGSFSLDRDLTINLNGHTISGDELYFDVGPDRSLTINGGGQYGSVGNIISGYANINAINSEGTVTLSHVNITTNSAYAIAGYGKLNIGNNVSFNGWTSGPFNTEDVNTEGGNYNSIVVATVTVGGKTHYFENLGAALVYIANNADKVDFSWSESDDTYTIHTATGWDFFCDLLEAGETFSGKTVELANDITVTRMAGLEGHEFQGTFDGNKKTLTVSISSSDGNAAPFREIMGATIRNLKVSGTVSGHKHSAGLVSYARGADSSVENTIENCLVATDVSTIVDTDGDCYLGGIVGHGFKSKLTIRGCAFTGSLTSPHNYTGGLQGWSDGNTLVLENDLFAASSVNAANVGFHPIAFHVNNATTTATVSNVYYTVAPTCTTASRIAAAGKACHSVTAGENVTIDAIALTGDATQYDVSGITAYSGGGLQRGETLYYGIDDVVSLTLSNTATGAPEGYQYGYTTNAGTLDGSTLTMPAADVTVSVNTDVLTVLPWSGDGSKSSPYIIKYASQLDLLAHRVNGTHGETANDYYNTYFKLDKDIKYTPTTDWDDAECEQENNYEAIGGYYGDDYRYFRGHFDGNKKTISGIRIYKDGTGYADYYQGIFGRTDEGADIHDLTLADARITGYGNTGGIVGYNVDGKVTHCHVAGDVAVCAVQSYVWYHGGIVGENGGTIEQCTSAATLTIANAANSRFYGGIAGYNSSRGTLSDNLAIGATVPAAADNNYGAITGENNGTLQRNYYANCNVNDTPNATGVGCGHISNDDDGYTTDDVNNDNNPNGARAVFALTLADGITTTTAATVTIGTTGYYAQGTAIALSYSGTIGDGYQLGIVRNDGNGFTAAVADGDGHYTAVMPAANATATDHAPIDWATVSTGADKDNAYMIYNKDQLDLLAHRVNGTHGETRQTDGYENKFFQLAKDISYPHKADGEEGADAENNYEAIGGYYNDGKRYFCGNFDGNNKTISGIRIYKDGDGDADRYQGIFGRTDSGADIHHLTLADARITGYDYTGGIVGSNNGTVSGCHVADDVAVCAVQSDAWSYGGIVGYNSGTIEQCTSAATLTTADATQSMYYGGIAGYNRSRGTLSDNLAIGATVPAAADNTYGAIVGNNYNGGTLQRNYYAACKVANVENATGVGCGYIGNGNGGYTTADVTANNGAVSINTLDLTANLAPDGNYWTTYYNGFLGFTIDADEHACAYTATYGDGQLTLHKLGKEIPKNTAVIIVADNSVVSMTAATTLPAYSGSTNALRGVNVDTPTSALGTGTLYVLGMTTVDNEQHFGFHRYTGEEMAAHKAYVLVGSNSQQAASLTMEFDEASGIESAEADSSLFTLHSSLSTWFTLDGRRLQAKPTAPGIYINNGRKVVIK